jgi:copper(I)-binding protein
VKRLIAALAICAFTAVSAMAEPSNIAVEHAWARATPKGATTGAAYITLVNTGASDDRLLRATSPVAETIQFHSETNDNGVMKMALLPTIAVGSGAQVTLKPGGAHMMLVGLRQPLKEGQTIPLTLTFEKAGDITTTAQVGSIAAMHDPEAHANGG